jgi:pilus assembly protein FimV
MKAKLSPVRTAALLLLAAPLSLAAQSLGPAQSEAWLGRALELTVPARLEGGGGDCPSAEVRYGARRIDGKHVQTFVQHTGGGQTQLRVRVDVPIDEPVVSVALRAGCGNTVARHYVVLAEPAPDEPSAPLVARTPAAPAVAATAAAAEPRHAGAAAATRVAGAGGTAVVAAMARPAMPAAPVQAPQPRVERASGDGPALLRVSAALANPLGDPAQRAVAARLWQAFQAEPHERVRTAEMLQSLEAELAALRRTAASTHAGVARVDAAPRPQAGSALLAVALLSGLGIGGAAWLRRRDLADRGPDLFVTRASPGDDPGPLPGPAAAVPSGQAMVADPAPMEPAPLLAAKAPGVAPAVVRAPKVVAAQAELAAKVASARAGATKGHIFRVDALASALQEAEFLGSLGLAGDAKAVLRAHLSDASSPAPLAYYELMHLCAQDDDEAREIPLLRRRFHEQFQIVAPSMDELRAPGGLENHPRLLARIASVWPTPVALDIIEKRLFARPEAADYQMTLEAWRDLVWLYEFAQQLQMGPAAAGAGQRSGSAVMAPWADMDTGGFDLLGGDFGRAHNFAVDFDLNAAAAPDEWSEGGLKLVPLQQSALAH